FVGRFATKPTKEWPDLFPLSRYVTRKGSGDGRRRVDGCSAVDDLSTAHPAEHCRNLGRAVTPADLLRSGAREKRRRQLPGKVPAGTRRARPPCIVERGDDDCEVVKVPTGTGRARPPCIVERGDTVKSFFLWVRVQGVIAACRGYGAATYHARPLTVKRKVRS